MLCNSLAFLKFDMTDLVGKKKQDITLVCLTVYLVEPQGTKSSSKQHSKFPVTWRRMPVVVMYRTPPANAAHRMRHSGPLIAAVVLREQANNTS